MKRICIVGISGKLGQYMLRHALDLGYEVTGVCREKSAHKLDAYKGRITLFTGPTDDRDLIRQAVQGCDGVLTVLAPWGVHDYASGTARAVLDHAEPDARLIFSCGWHITRDGKDIYSWKLRTLLAIATPLARWLRAVDINDQVVACDAIFASNTRWTVVRGSNLEEGESEGLPIWRRHAHDPALAHNRMRRIDFARFMVAALTDDALVREAPAIAGYRPHLAAAPDALPAGA